MTESIPKPEVLDPDRVNRDARENFTLEDHRSRGDLLSQALEETCSYATQLWETIDVLRSYLIGSIPPDPRKPGAHRAGAAPTGPADETGWQNWINAFAIANSAMCGPHGDSGYGLSRAREEAQVRRSAPELMLHAEHPQLDAPTGGVAVKTSPEPPDSTAGKSRWAAAKAVAGVVVCLLAVRGLRPRRA
jgi:hypothetical protein